jgi:hypothetical protein
MGYERKKKQKKNKKEKKKRAWFSLLSFAGERR